jgi:hypothetical protein
MKTLGPLGAKNKSYECMMLKTKKEKEPVLPKNCFKRAIDRKDWTE